MLLKGVVKPQELSVIDAIVRCENAESEVQLKAFCAACSEQRWELGWGGVVGMTPELMYDNGIKQFLLISLGEPCSTSAENDDTSVNDDRAYKILSETWNCGFGTEEASKKSKHYVDLAGSKPRLPVCIFTFVMKYLRQFYQPFNHLPYIWRFLCELASDAMDEREIPSEVINCNS